MILAGRELLRTILASKGNPNPHQLLVGKHRLYEALLSAGKDSSEKIASPLDQALIARCLSKSGKWRKASLVRSEVAFDIWCLRAIAANCLRLLETQSATYITLFDTQLPGTLAAREEIQLDADDQSGEESDDSDDSDSSEDEEDSDPSMQCFTPLDTATWSIDSALALLADVLDPSHSLHSAGTKE